MFASDIADGWAIIYIDTHLIGGQLGSLGEALLSQRQSQSCNGKLQLFSDLQRAINLPISVDSPQILAVAGID